MHYFAVIARRLLQARRISLILMLPSLFGVAGFRVIICNSNVEL